MLGGWEVEGEVMVYNFYELSIIWSYKNKIRKVFFRGERGLNTLWDFIKV